MMLTVGRFFWSRGDIQRRVILDRYEGAGTERQRASRLSMSLGRFKVEQDRLLCSLSGWLQAVDNGTLLSS